MPVTSDQSRRLGHSGFVARGIGMSPTFRCWGCDQTRSTTGAKLVGPLKLKHCAECIRRGA